MKTDSINITAASENNTAAPPIAWREKPVFGLGYLALRWGLNRFIRAMAELTAVLLGAGIIWLGLLTSIMAKGEADVSFLKRNFSLWFAQAYDGQEAEIDTFKVQWHPSRGTIGLLIKGISVHDDAGETLLTVKSIYTESPITMMLNKGFEVRRLDLEGGQLTIKRDQTGAVFGAIGEPKSFGRLGPMIPIASSSNNTPSQNAIDSVSLSGTDVFFRDDILGVALNLSAVNFETNVFADEIVAMGNSKFIVDDVKGNSPTSISTPQVNVELRRGRKVNKALEVTIDIMGFNPANLQFKSEKFNALNQIDTPLDLMINWHEIEDVERRLEFSVLQHNKDILSDVFSFKNVEDLSVLGEFDLINDTLFVEEFRLLSEDVTLDIQGNMTGLIAQQDNAIEAVKFDLDIDRLKWASKTALAKPLDIKKGRVQGAYNHQDAVLTLVDVALPINNYILKTQGEMVNVLGGIEDVSPSMKLKGAFLGTLSENDLLGLWPKTFVLGGRNWVKTSIVSATLSDMKFDVDISDFSKLEGGLPDDAVTLDFRIKDGLVDYIRTMPPLDNASGFGQLRANGLELTLSSGNVGHMVIENGRVEIPQFFPYGNNFTIEFEGRGPVDYMVELIDKKPFEYASLYNLSPKDFSGQGRAKLKVTRPLKENFDQSLIRYDIDVMGENVSAPFGLGGYELTKGTLFLTADKTGMTIKGPAQLGPLLVDINWRETFDFGATPTSLTLSSQIDSAALDKFGISLREYFGGDIPFTLSATGDGVSFDTARISADLLNSELVISDIWSKSSGTAGSLDLSLSRRLDGQVLVDDFQAIAPGLEVAGALQLDKNMRLLEASIDRFSIENFVDARLTLTREIIDQPLQAILSGDYLNLESFIGPTLWQSEGGGNVPLILSANLNSLRLAQDYQINKASLVYNNTGFAIDQFRFSGSSDSGPVNFDLQTLEGGPFSNRLRFDVANASDLVRAFFNLDNITGGRLYGEAVRPREGRDLIWSGTVNVDDFTLIDAPFLAQMLSLASLDGLSDVLSGEGINFETIELPFTWGDGIIGLESARAAGPALGLTGDGQINISAKNIDIDGTLIPAYAANSILGSIPIIGDIFGGNADDATLGLTYKVNGDLGEAQVSVNPLSALTPGILRTIFKPNREKKRIEIPSDVINESEADTP